MHFSLEFDLLDAKDTYVLEDLIEIMQLRPGQEATSADSLDSDKGKTASGSGDSKRGSSPEQ